MRQIVVVGCGFGGFRAAREIEKTLGGRRRVQLTVVAEQSEFVYTPLLASVAAAELQASHISFPIRDALEESTKFITRSIDSVDLKARYLRSAGGDIKFDYLIIATGSQTDWGEHPEWAELAMSFNDVEDALFLRETVARALQEAAQAESSAERRRLLTFVIAGGGPTGVELGAALLAALRRDISPRDHAEIASAIRVVIVEREARLLPKMPAQLGELAREHLGELGMELRIGTSVLQRDESSVGLSTGEVIEADHLIWCGGVRPGGFAEQSGFDLDADGRLAVTSTLKVRKKGRPVPGIFAVGDIAATGDLYPYNAQVANHQGVDAAYNLIADMSGRTPHDWEYRANGELISMGREQAIAFLAGAAIDGRAATTLYRLVHTALMPGGVRKATLLKDWLLNPRRLAAPGALLGTEERGLLEASDG